MIPKVIHKVLIVDEGKIPELPEGMNKGLKRGTDLIRDIR